MDLGTNDEEMHYLNARRTYSRDKINLEEDYRNNLSSLEQALNTFPDIRAFLGEEELIWHDHIINELTKKGKIESNLGYAIMFYKVIKPVSEHQAELKENLSLYLSNQHQIYRGLRKVKKVDEDYISKKLLVTRAHASDDENEKMADRMLSSLPRGLNISKSDADFFDYYKRKTEYDRCIFAGLHPYRASFSELRYNMVFYTGVSSFMLSLKRSIEDCEKIVKAHLGRWNI
jgi:hypothetical protein